MFSDARQHARDVFKKNYVLWRGTTAGTPQHVGTPAPLCYHGRMNWTTHSLTAHLNATLEPDAPDLPIAAMSSLEDARPGDISFLGNPKYEKQVATTRATAVLVPAAWQWSGSATATPVLLRVEDPNKAFAQLAPIFGPPPVVRKPGVHPTAVVAPDAVIAPDAHIGPYVVIDERARIGSGAVIEAFTFVGAGAVVGDGSRLYPHVTLREGCTLGRRCIIHSGAVIGGDGFGFTITMTPEGSVKVDKIPQVGIVEIGDDVEIGSNSTLDRARFGRTRVGNSVKIDNLVQIGHNVQIGDFTGIVAQAGIAGSTKVGSGVMLWAQAGISGHLTIHDRAQVGPQSGVAADVPPGAYVIGTPAGKKREFLAQRFLLKAVERLRKRVETLEAMLKGKA